MTPGRWWFLGALAASALALLPTLGFVLGHDHGSYQYLGWAILQGSWPYTDVWDTAFPGLVLVHAAVIKLGGPSAFALRVFDFFIQLVTAGLVFGLVRRFAPPRAGLIAAVIYATAYTAGGINHSAQREGFMVPLILGGTWALWCYFDAYFEGERRRWAAIAGGVIGVACLLQPAYTVLSGALAVVLFSASRGRSRGFGVRFSDTLTFSVLSVFPLVLFFCVYVVRGDLSTLSDTALYLLHVYTNLERASLLEVLLRALPPTLIWLGMAISLLSPPARKHTWHYASLAFMLGVCLLIRVLDMKTDQYRLWPLWVFASMLAGVGWDFAMTNLVRASWLPESGRRAAGSIGTALLLVVPALGSSEAVERYRTSLDQLQTPREQVDRFTSLIDDRDLAEVARYIHLNSSRNDLVQMWGASPMLPFAARRRVASRFIDTKAFVCASGEGGVQLFTNCAETPGTPVQVAFRDDLLESLQATPPRFIVASYSPDSLAVERGCCLAPDLPDLRLMLENEYRLETRFGVWSVFGRREPEPDPVEPEFDPFDRSPLMPVAAARVDAR